LLLERLDTAALRRAYVEAVLPPDLPAAYQAEARRRADEFAAVVLSHVFGDDSALGAVAEMVHGGAADSLQAGEHAGTILDRLDAGRRVVLGAVDALAPAAGTISALDDRFAAVLSAARRAVEDAVAEHAGVIEAAVAGVVGETEAGLRPEQVMVATARAFAALVDADTAHLWLEVGGGLVELVASIGTTAITQSLFVSSESGAIAEVMRGGPERRFPLKGGDSFQAWRELLPELEPSAAALVVPLLLGGQPLGVLIGLRQRREPFQGFQERDGVRFARRVEQTLAWSLQTRVAERVSIATQDFLRVTTHELRRPLTVLRGYVDMLRDAHPEDVPGYRDNIDRAAERLAELLSELTEMVILEDPLRPLGIAEHRLGTVVERAAQAARDEAAQQGCVLVVEVDQGDTVVHCDTHHVEHAIANLLSNAFRHTRGQRCVWLRGAPRGDRSWSIAVRDEGPGFDPVDAERLFEKYYRSETTRSSGAPGSGLGLHYVRLVAERHGGRVSAAGDGSGAEFTLILPRVPGMMPWPG
jgi:signal transduction histidine kinase